MKKAIAIIFALLFCLTFCSCDPVWLDKMRSLKYVKAEYEDEMLEHAKGLGGEGSYECVILGKDETIANLQNYEFNPPINEDELKSGLFVKHTFMLDGVSYTVYYNYGLEFKTAQESDFEVTTKGANESWMLEKVDFAGEVFFEKEIIKD